MVIALVYSFLPNVFNMLSTKDQGVNLVLFDFSWDAIEGHLFQAARLMTLSQCLAFGRELRAREGK